MKYIQIRALYSSLKLIFCTNAPFSVRRFLCAVPVRAFHKLIVKFEGSASDAGLFACRINPSHIYIHRQLGCGAALRMNLQRNNAIAVPFCLISQCNLQLIACFKNRNDPCVSRVRNLCLSYENRAFGIHHTQSAQRIGLSRNHQNFSCFQLGYCNFLFIKAARSTIRTRRLIRTHRMLRGRPHYEFCIGIKFICQLYLQIWTL